MFKRLSFKQTLFLLPLLLILGVFSVYPIITSFVYSFFDYQANDQQRAGLYLRNYFNPRVFHEDAFFISFRLIDEISLMPAESVNEAQEIRAFINNFIARYENETEIRAINANETERINNFINETEARLNSLYDGLEGALYKDDMPILIDGMRRRFIEPNFIGLRNYGALFRDSRFFSALGFTSLFTAVSVFFELILGMALALILNKAVKGIGIVRTTSLIPWAVPTAVAALMWSYLYDGSSGIIAHIFSVIGILEQPQNMLLSASGAMASAILADVWKTTPYMALLLLAGLQTIDSGLYESADIDGSGTINAFLKITLPLMKSSVLVALLFRMLDAFRVYDLIAVLTGGGPGNATETLSIYSHRLMISQSNFGYGSTVVVAMFVCVAIIAFFFVKIMGAELVRNED